MAGVRPARDTDLPVVEPPQWFVPHPSSDFLDVWPAVGTLLVAVDVDDRPIGYLLGVGAYLTELAVPPDHRRRGRVIALVEAFRDAYRSGADAADAPLTLLVHPENGGARACHEAFGFRRDVRIPDALDGDDGPRLVLD